MLKAILILIVICILSWIFTIFYEKYKYIAIFVTFLSFISIFLGFVDFFTDYEPLEVIKETIISYDSKPTKSSSSTPSEPIEVSLPKKSNLEKTSDKDDIYSNQQKYIVKTTILNIGETVHRDENNKIYVVWAPFVNQENYKIKITVDDPFSSTEKEHENICKNNWCYIDVSDYPYDTIIFLSVGMLDSETSEWIYSDPIHFTLY